MSKVYPLSKPSTAGELDRSAMLALGLYGKVGPSNGCGSARCSSAKGGDHKAIAGIYQRRKIGYNQYTGPPSSEAGLIHVKMKSYRPTNPQTALQQSWRSVFADGVAAWQSLTTDEKKTYNSKASHQGLSGFNLFMRGYLRSHV